MSVTDSAVQTDSLVPADSFLPAGRNAAVPGTKAWTNSYLRQALLVDLTCALAAGAVAVFGAVLAGHLILPGHGFTAARGFPSVWLSYGPTLRAACGSVLYLVLIALLSLGVAVIVRDSATSIGVVLALLYVFPIVTSVITNQHWQRHLEQIGPMTAGLDIQATANLSSLPLTPWQGLGVLALWAAGALVVGALVFRFRDA